MELIESVIWIVGGFLPTMAVLVGISRAGIFKIKKHGRIARLEVKLPGYTAMKK